VHELFVTFAATVLSSRFLKLLAIRPLAPRTPPAIAKTVVNVFRIDAFHGFGRGFVVALVRGSKESEVGEAHHGAQLCVEIAARARIRSIRLATNDSVSVEPSDQRERAGIKQSGFRKQKAGPPLSS
jgi:hypothetical protein